MVSKKRRITPREEQLIRFLDAVRENGNEPAIDELGETLGRLVPPVRAAGVKPAREEVEDRESSTT